MPAGLVLMQTIITKMLCKKSLKKTFRSNKNRQETENTESRKANFLKEQVENADLHQSIRTKSI